MSYDPNKREEWWDLEVGQCRGCSAPVEEDHKPGCPELEPQRFADRMSDLTPITRRCIQPVDDRESA